MNNDSIFNSLHYYSADYESKARFASYWHQIQEIRQRNPKSILEIGKGSGFLSRYLNNFGLNLITMDIVPNLSPDVIGTVLTLPFGNNSFDMVVCFQVLEHLPFQYFSSCLEELSRVSRQYVIISLPDASRALTFFIRSTGRVSLTKIMIIPHFKKKEHKFDGEHYWLIGKKGYPLRLIRKVIKNTGIKLINTYRVPEFLVHRFFILQK